MDARTGLAALASGLGTRALLTGIIPRWLALALGTILILFSAFCFGAAVWRELFATSATPDPDTRRIPRAAPFPEFHAKRYRRYSGWPPGEAAMRILLMATVALLPAKALAQPVVDPAGPWQQRIDTCVMEWNNATPVQRGTMSYRQFAMKCVGGQTALPIDTKALCQDGNVSAATAPEGACANDGGVVQWME